ncbi:MAG: ACP S-malonyltransferase [Pirellulales bacterium]
MSSSDATAILFPGQGAQSVGMVGEWCSNNSIAMGLFQKASEILGYDLFEICRAGPSEKLNTTAVSQPGILVTSLAALELLRDRDPIPLESATITAGLSLGEYTALVFANVLSFEDAVRLVHIRGCAVQGGAEQSPGGMVAILGLEREKVEEVCEKARQQDELRVANALCPGNIVVSGSDEACSRVTSEAAAAGAMKTVRLDVAGAFHTVLMKPAVEKLRVALSEVSMQSPRIPVVSNVDARPHTNPEEIRDLLAEQVCGVVEWNASMEYMLSTQVQSVWEVGPGRVLRGLLKRIDRRKACRGVFD